MKNNASQILLDGFTLIEVLLVIAILAVLSSVVIFTINPQRQLTEAFNAQRKSDIYTIMNALHQYALDNENMFPDTVTVEQFEICRTGATECTGKYDLSVLTDDQKYLVSIPRDPLCASLDVCDETQTGYLLTKTSGGRMSLTAEFAEGNEIFLIR